MRRILVITMLVLLAIRGGLTQTGETPRVSATYSSLVAEGSGKPTPRPVLLALTVTPEPTPLPTAKPTARPVTHKPVAHTTTSTKPKLTTARPAPAKTKPAATPKATSKPKATPAPQRSRSFNKDDVKQRIAATWDGDDEKALQVVGCETAWTYNPAMTSDNGRYFGLWQFDMETWQRWGGSGDPRDASVETQTQIAWKLFSSRGWAPWPYCSTH